MHCYYFHVHKLFSLHAKSIGLKIERIIEGSATFVSSSRLSVLSECVISGVVETSNRNYMGFLVRSWTLFSIKLG